MRKLEKMKRSIDTLSFGKSIDRAIYGLQVQNCDLVKLEKVKKIIKKKYKVDMNRIGPIVADNWYRQVLLAEEITEKLKKDDRIRDYANQCGFPTRSVYYPGDDPEQILDGIIFFLVFNSLMNVSFKFTEPAFRTFIQNGASDEVMKKLFSVAGHLNSEIESYMKGISEEIVRKINKSKK